MQLCDFVVVERFLVVDGQETLADEVARVASSGSGALRPVIAVVDRVGTTLALVVGRAIEAEASSCVVERLGRGD